MRDNVKSYIGVIENKELILFGAGDFARKFLRDFAGQFDIDCCISNNPSEKELATNDGCVYNIYNVNERLKSYSGELIVLCAAAHEEMEQQLFYMGYRYGEHYIDSGILRCLMSGKKMTFVYGVCYMRAIHDCLKSSKVFADEYEMYYRLSYQNMQPHEYDAFSFILSCCDLYLYNSVLTYAERMKNEAFICKLPKECRKISVPVVSFAGYHPQTIDNHGIDNQYCVVSKKTDWASFMSPDCNINGLLEQGCSTSEIRERISIMDYYTPDFLEKQYRQQIFKLEFAESESDIKISDFIKVHRGKTRLFFNETHISNEVIVELTKRILTFLGIKADLPEEDLLDMELLHTSEVPLYPSVIKGMDLEIYQGNDVKYRMFTFHGYQWVTFEEYIEYYCDFCRNMKRYMETGLFPG